MSWKLTDLTTGKQEQIESFNKLQLKEAYYKGMNLDYSVTHNNWIKTVTFSHDKTL